MTGLKSLIDNINSKGRTSREYMTITQEGRYIIRILQDIHNELEAPFEHYLLHRIYHPFFKREAALRCIGYACPLCANAREIEKQDRANGWKFKATDAYIYNIIERKTGQLKILKVSWAAHDAIKAKIIEAANDGINLGHFKNGRDIEIEVRKVGDKLKYKGYILSEAESKPVAPKIIEELKLVKPLSEMYRLHTKQELQDIVDGKVPQLPQHQEKKKHVGKASLIDNLTKKDQATRPSIIKDDIKPTVAKTSTPASKKAEDSGGEGGAINDRLSKLNIFDKEGESGNE